MKYNKTSLLLFLATIFHSHVTGNDIGALPTMDSADKIIYQDDAQKRVEVLRSLLEKNKVTHDHAKQLCIQSVVFAIVVIANALYQFHNPETPIQQAGRIISALQQNTYTCGNSRLIISSSNDNVSRSTQAVIYALAYAANHSKILLSLGIVNGLYCIKKIQGYNKELDEQIKLIKASHHS